MGAWDISVLMRFYGASTSLIGSCISADSQNSESVLAKTLPSKVGCDFSRWIHAQLLQAITEELKLHSRSSGLLV